MEFVTVLCAIGVTLLFMEVVSLERDIENLEIQVKQLKERIQEQENKTKDGE